MTTTGEGGPWVLLSYRMPREPSTPRIGIWRKLKRLGVAQLSDGLVALPADARTREHLEWIADEVIEAGGAATIWLAPPPAPPSDEEPDLDTDALDEVMGTEGTNAGGIYKFSFARAETITDHHKVLPPAMGVTTAIGFQPTGDGDAAINGDFAMTADEVQPVIQALRRGGIDVVALHNHGLGERPRLFYLHFWAEDDAVQLARSLKRAVEATDVTPAE